MVHEMSIKTLIEQGYGSRSVQIISSGEFDRMNTSKWMIESASYGDWLKAKGDINGFQGKRTSAA